MDIIEVDDPADAQIAAWHAVVAAASGSADQVPDPADTAAGLRLPGPGRRRWAVRAADGGLAAVCHLSLPDDPGRAGEIEVHVRPGHRRRGAGTELLAIAADTLRSAGCKTVIAQVLAGTPAVPFLEACGFRRVLTLRAQLLTLADLDRSWLAGLAAAGPAGYRTVRWTGTVPSGLAAELAHAKKAMADLTVDMAADTPGRFTWDVDRVREMAAMVANRGDHLCTVAALYGPVGAPRLAGFTEVVVPGDGAHRAVQYDTAVVPEHRGRRLGIWLKARMLEWLLAEWPGVMEIETDNADDNDSMLAVNRELGFRIEHEFMEYQADVADLPAGRLVHRTMFG